MSTSGLGPHVEGLRVVIRRLVPGETGPTGGPAFTDVLGTCLVWGPVVEVETARGVVQIPRSLIVSGKPIGPKPVRRPRT